jgi:hypothetical protein
LKTLRVILLALALVGAPAPAALAANELPGVGPVALAGDLGGATLAIPGYAGAAYRVHWLTNPYRLAVDLRGHWLGAPESSLWLGGGLVTRIRASRHGGGLTRIVFDLQAPADVRTENRGGALVFVVVPRGGRAPAYAPPYAAQMAPPYAAPMAGPYAPPSQPIAMPTPRPVPYPGYAGYSGYAPYQGYAPAPRVTPIPVLPPAAWGAPQPPAMTYPAPQVVQQPPAMPLPAYPPSAPPVAMANPYPVQAAQPMPQPAGQPGPPAMPDNDDPFADEAKAPPRPFFGSRAYLGPGLAVGLTETFPKGAANISAGLAPNMEGGLDQMFSPMLGLHVGIRQQGYSFSDDQLGDKVKRKHTRDEQDVRLGFRTRFDVGGGLEVFAQPQVAVRNVMVGTTVADAPPVEGFSKLDEYLSTSHLGYGGGLGLGLGYPFNDTIGLALGGEVNYMLGGGGKAAQIYPLLNAGGGLDLRFNFSGFGLCVGYKANMLSNGGVEYNWLSHGPAITLGANY